MKFCFLLRMYPVLLQEKDWVCQLSLVWVDNPRIYFQWKCFAVCIGQTLAEVRGFEFDPRDLYPELPEHIFNMIT